MNIADRIQHLRKAEGLSQEELADKVGVSRQAVSKWESGQSTPDLDKVVMMSDLFKVTTDYILKGVEPEPTVHKSRIQFLYIGFAIIFAVIAVVWSYASNRFAQGECILIVLAGAAVGVGVSLVIHVISALLKSK